MQWALGKIYNDICDQIGNLPEAFVAVRHQPPDRAALLPPSPHPDVMVHRQQFAGSGGVHAACCQPDATEWLACAP